MIFFFFTIFASANISCACVCTQFLGISILNLVINCGYGVILMFATSMWRFGLYGVTIIYLSACCWIK